MNILALDSAGLILSIALETANGVFYTEIDAGSRHSELLVECAGELCKTAELSPLCLEAVVCAKGPGSFTGLRIGYSVAKGYCLALGIPLIAISTLDSMAYPLSVWPGIVLPAIDAKKGCFFTALYRNGDRISDYLDASPEIILKSAEKAAISPNEPIIITGSGANMLYLSLSKLVPTRSIKINPRFRMGVAKELLEMSKKVIITGVNGIDSGPDYIRKSDAELMMTNRI